MPELYFFFCKDRTTHGAGGRRGQRSAAFSSAHRFKEHLPLQCKDTAANTRHILTTELCFYYAICPVYKRYFVSIHKNAATGVQWDAAGQLQGFFFFLTNFNECYTYIFYWRCEEVDCLALSCIDKYDLLYLFFSTHHNTVVWHVGDKAFCLVFWWDSSGIAAQQSLHT